MKKRPVMSRRHSLKSMDYLNKLKLRRFYGNLGERQFKRIFKNSRVSSNVLSKSFSYLIESRLDVILYRSNFFDSIFSARQYISHRKVCVNGSTVDRPGYKLTLDDIVTLKNAELLYGEFKERLLRDAVLFNYPKYLEVNYKLASIILISLPLNEEVPYPFFININYMIYSYLK
jgi:small subunit ribosomal protein S4